MSQQAPHDEARVAALAEAWAWLEAALRTLWAEIAAWPGAALERERGMAE